MLAKSALREKIWTWASGEKSASPESRDALGCLLHISREFMLDMALKGRSMCGVPFPVSEKPCQAVRLITRTLVRHSLFKNCARQRLAINQRRINQASGKLAVGSGVAMADCIDPKLSSERKPA